MIARPTQFAALALMAATLLGGLALPQDAQARDGHSRSYDYQHDDRGYRDYDDGPRYERGRKHYKKHNHQRYAPRYYPDVVVYREAPRVYYPAPYYYGPVEYDYYPRDYGTVGIHLDYNLRY